MSLADAGTLSDALDRAGRANCAITELAGILMQAIVCIDSRRKISYRKRTAIALPHANQTT
jgi:hypothetical protein